MVRQAVFTQCKSMAAGLRGGALASRVFEFTKHGDPDTKALVARLLTLAVAPMHSTLTKCMHFGSAAHTDPCCAGG